MGECCLFAHIRLDLSCDFLFLFLSLISYHHVIFRLKGKLEEEIHPLLWRVDRDGETVRYFARFSGDLHDHRAALLLCPLNQLP